MSEGFQLKFSLDRLVLPGNCVCRTQSDVMGVTPVTLSQFSVLSGSA